MADEILYNELNVNKLTFCQTKDFSYAPSSRKHSRCILYPLWDFRSAISSSYLQHEQECLSDIKHESAARVFYISDTEITTANVLNGLSDPFDEFIGEIILKLSIV
jgi:hypothetical protein